MTPRMKLWVAASRGATSVCCSTPDGRGLVWSESIAVGPRPGLIMKALHRVAPASRRRRRSAPHCTVNRKALRFDLGSHLLRKNDVGSSANAPALYGVKAAIAKAPHQRQGVALAHDLVGVEGAGTRHASRRRDGTILAEVDLASAEQLIGEGACRG